MLVDLERTSRFGGGAAFRAAGSLEHLAPNVAEPVRLIVTVTRFGQVTVRGRVDREVVDREPARDRRVSGIGLIIAV